MTWDIEMVIEILIHFNEHLHNAAFPHINKPPGRGQLLEPNLGFICLQ